MNRVLMKPLTENGEVTLRCKHEKVWPPPHLHLIPKPLGLDVEYLRFRVPDETYLRVKTWQGVCGLTAMNAERCGACPHALREGEKPLAPQTGVRPIVRTAATARAKSAPKEPAAASRRPGVPHNEKVREYLTLEARKARVDRNDPQHVELDARMKRLLQSMSPNEQRQLQVISRTAKP